MSLPVTGSPDMEDGRAAPEPLRDARLRQRRARSVAIAVALAALALLFYLVTIVKLGPGVLERPL
jgi:hypothetical protein